MNIFYDLNECPEGLANTVATLGNFDGVHRGHQRIFKALLQEASKCGGCTMVITFFPHPLKVLAPDRAPRAITTLEERLRLLQTSGVEYVLCLPFTLELASLTPEEFVQGILVKKLGVKKALVGEDFRFGRDRQGDLALLRRLGRRLGFGVRMIRPLRFRGQQVSSTRVRELIQAGRIQESSDLLGRYYGIMGAVVRGDGRGKTLGFPTANLQTDAELIPPQGVYAVLASLAGDVIPGVANLGTKPTFPGKPFSIEVHLFDFHRDIYGQSLRMDFVARIRDERKFQDVDGLIRQMHLDLRDAREILRQASPRSVQERMA